jgi:hypothetical protein
MSGLPHPSVSTWGSLQIGVQSRGSVQASPPCRSFEAYFLTTGRPGVEGEIVFHSLFIYSL